MMNITRLKQCHAGTQSSRSKPKKQCEWSYKVLPALWGRPKYDALTHTIIAKLYRAIVKRFNLNLLVLVGLDTHHSKPPNKAAVEMVQLVSEVSRPLSELPARTLATSFLMA